jgi:anti-sigma-K factor RskA
MSTSREALREALCLYALGEVTAEEAMALEKTLAGDPESMTELRELTETVHRLASLAPATAPPPAVFDAIVAKIEEEKAGRVVPRPGPAPAWKPTPSWLRTLPLLAASLAATAVVVVLWFREHDANVRNAAVLDSTRAQLAVEVRDRRAVEGQLSAIRSELETSQDLFRMLQSTDLKVALLGPKTADVAGVVRVLWRPQESTWMVLGSGLARPPQDRDLQLWGLKDGHPIAAPILPIAPDGTLRRRITLTPELAGSEAAAITVEPRGGGTTPRGPMVFFGTL